MSAPQDRASLRTRYEAGETVSDIAASIGYSAAYVYDLLSEAGTVMRRSGPPPTWHPPGYAERTKRDAEILQRYQDGETSRELGRALGISKATVQRVVRKAGIARPPGRRLSENATALAAQIVDDYESGKTMAVIAESTGMSVSFVKDVLIRHDIEIRPRNSDPFRGLNAFTEENRILFAAANPGKPNPFTCQADVPGGCNELADPGAHYLCGRHRARIERTGIVARPCASCGRDRDTPGGGYLCSSCYGKGWRYCTSEHLGSPVVTIADMPSVNSSGSCRECARIERLAKLGFVCQKCGKPILADRIHVASRTLCLDCWDGQPGCVDRSPECSENPQLQGEEGQKRCYVHHSRAWQAGLVARRPPCAKCGAKITNRGNPKLCDDCRGLGWKRCGKCGRIWQRPVSVKGTRAYCPECMRAWGEGSRRKSGVSSRTDAQRNRSKLTQADVHAIRASQDSFGKLASQYGVSKTTVSRIKRGAVWVEG
jgi:hypothetical protein